MAGELHCRRLTHFHVHTKELPHYRFVDVYRAAEAFCQGYDRVTTLASEHHDDLNTLLHARRQHWASRRIKHSRYTAWPVGPRQEGYLPIDHFWLCHTVSPDTSSRLIVRLRYHSFSEKAILEAAAERAQVAETCLATIVEQSAQASIYRNRVLELSYESGVKDEYGDVERPDRLRVLFKDEEQVDEDDMVLDDEVRQMLWRNVIDLHRQRALLKAYEVPVRRGVLLYGPPGTGKTFACRYLCSQLPDTTRIVVTGTALGQVHAIFGLARMLQPALLILEDVDLVFAAREINLYSSVLGDFLDHLDGLRPSEEVGCILTTNAIDRLEAAIRDRPGRISQCIRFSAPPPALRRRYLCHYLRRYATAQVDLEVLVTASHGATQAFLKEWVHRAVQMALERLTPPGDEPLALCTEDFHCALREMRRFSEEATGRIIGFYGPTPTSPESL
jgi:AAA+ superfamily predicted ATPase